MNNKEAQLWNIVDVVVGCCATQIDEEGNMSLTKEDVLGKSRSENVIMTRCILATIIRMSGYSVTTIAQLLNKTSPAVRHLIEEGNKFRKTSRAYFIAEAEAVCKCRSLSYI